MKVPSCTFGQLKTSANSFHGRRLWERSLKEKLENEVHYHHVYGVQERLRRAEIVDACGTCLCLTAAVPGKKTKEFWEDLMLAASDQCFIEGLEMKVHVGNWSERSPARV